MCDVAESTIQEVLLARLAAPECKEATPTRQDLLRATQAQGACVLHTLGALRRLLRNGYVAAEAPEGSADPASDPDSRWRISAAPGAVQAPEAGRRLGNYTYSPADCLGRGRLGHVVRGRNDFLRRDVAIKFLSREYTDNPNFRRRFEREARILARLDHPHIVKVYDGGQDTDGTYYIAMEYIEGGTLVDLAKKMGRLPATLVAKYGYQIASALAAAHRHGILHRDVKPDNVMMTPDGAKLADFNLAGIDEASVQEIPSALESVASEVGKPPQPVGTFAYMAPERMNGQRGDLRSDIYSLGATLYAVAAGGYLFEGIGTGPDSYMNWRWHHAKETPRPLPDRVPGFPPALWAILEKCLEKDPDQRFASYEELLQELATVRRQIPVEGEDAAFVEGIPHALVSEGQPFVPWRRMIAAAGGGLAILLFVVLNPFKGRSETRAQPPAARKPEATILEADPPPVGAEIPGALKEPPPCAPEAVPAPPPPPAPMPFEKRLAAYSPTADEISLIGALMDLFAAHRRELLSRSYDPLLQAIAALERERLGPRPGDFIPSEKEYSARHLRTARDLVLHAQGAVQARLKAILSSKGGIALKLADGSSASGSIAGQAPGSIRLNDGVGKEFAVPLSTIASEEFLTEDAPSPVRVAVQGLSLEPGRTLGEVLGLQDSAGELLFAIPLLVRLGRLEAEERIRAAIAQVKEAAARPGSAPPADGERALAALKSFAGNATAVLGFYRTLDTEFKAAAREEEALQALLASQYSRVLASYEGTLSHPAAAELLLARFESDLRAGSEELMAGTGFVDFGWRLRPPEADEKKKRGLLRRDPDEDAILLADTVGPRHFLMEEGIPQAPEGVLVRFRFEPLGTSPYSSEWRFPLVSGRGGGVYLKLQDRTLGLYRPVFAPEARDQELATSRIAANQGFRTLVLIPGESGLLHVYLDGALVFSPSLKDAAIPRALGFTVLGGRLTIKNVIVKNPPPSTKEDPK